MNKVDVSAYIRDLLLNHDCVIIPGFGGFIGNYTPAAIDRNSGTFYPPVKRISFNRNLNHNDGLLAGRISGSASVSYDEARRYVEEFVKELRGRLSKGEKVVLEGIGSLTNNQEGNVQFEPDRNVNYHLDSYGLDSFQCFPLEGYDVRKRIMKPPVKDGVRQTSVKRLFWRAAVIVPVMTVLVAVALKTDIFKPVVETTNLNPLVTAELEHNRSDVDDDTGKELTDDSDEPATVYENQVTPEVIEPEEGGIETYYIVVGSFQSKKNADLQAEALKTDGFSPEIIPGPNGFFRVSAITSGNMDDALLKKESLTGAFPGAWITRRK